MWILSYVSVGVCFVGPGFCEQGLSIHLWVNARKTGTISRHNSSCGVAIGHSFWKIKPMLLKFLLEMANLEVIRFPIFQKN